MLKTVHIFQKSDGKFIASYPIELRGANYTPSDSEYFDLAFENAVEDGKVGEGDRPKVKFEFA